ncbi:MAG TPA: Flp pilus assembly protein CpaB [Acidimicrobiales bacterium]|nr:Flp pilus assembly protein CpaB [Acidimicrobiales bacterium]
MNARQRRGTLFLVLSMVLATVVFLGVVGYVGSVNREVGPRVTVYRAASAIDPYQPLSESNLVAVQIPRQWVSGSALVRRDELVGRRVGFRVAKGTTISTDMLVAASDLSPTEREIAIDVDAVTGLAGRVAPGNRVDIYAVFGDVPGLPKQVRVLVRNVRVVSVGGTQSRSAGDDATKISAERQVLPVTLALEPDDALAVTYAGAFAKEVRLVGLPTDDTLNRAGEKGTFDAGDLGGEAVPEGGR